MRSMFRVLVTAAAMTMLVASGAWAQTNTPTNTATNTPTPTNTPTLMPKATEGSTDFRAYQYGSFRLDPASISTDTCLISNVIIPGLKPGDQIVLSVPSALETALFYSGNRIVSNNTLGVRLCAGTTTDGAALDWEYLWFSRTQNNCQGNPPNCGRAPTITPTATATKTPS